MLSELIFEALDNSEPSESTSSLGVSDESRRSSRVKVTSADDDDEPRFRMVDRRFSSNDRMGIFSMLMRRWVAVGGDAVLFLIIGIRRLSLASMDDEIFADDRLIIDFRALASSTSCRSTDVA